MEGQFSDEEIIEKSKQEPHAIFESDDGKVIFNGEIYKSKEHLHQSLKLMINPPRILRLAYRIGNLFSSKENKIDMSKFKKPDSTF